jgi:hypothetical protein
MPNGMPTGEFKITDIPTQADVDALKTGYALEVPPPGITVEGEAPGPFTMIARYPGPGSETETFSARLARLAAGSS